MSNNVLIGIVSYLPDDGKIRTKRLEGIRLQAEKIRSIYPDNEFVVIAQNYREDELITDLDITYKVYSEPLGAGRARNLLLEYFYESDYDFLMLCDDDTIWYPYYDIAGFFKHINSKPEDFYDAMAISLLEPEYHPYKKANYEDRRVLDSHRFIPRELNSGSALGFILNIRKHKGTILYFQNIDANNGEGREDIDFLIRWLLKGYTWYTLTTGIKKNLNMNTSSIFGDDVERRDKILQKDLDALCAQYKDYGLSRDSKGRITWKNFNNNYNNSKKIYYIDRLSPICYNKEEVPKYKSRTASKKLF